MKGLEKSKNYFRYNSRGVHLKRILGMLQVVVQLCTVDMGKSFKDNLKEWEGSSVWVKRAEMDFLINFMEPRK